jgi:hypothetical protein
LVIALIVGSVGCRASDSPELRDGDLIFHRSQSAQANALERALKSPYTHMGIIFIEDGKPIVYEAVGPVKRTPFDEWTARGRGGSYVVRRLKNANTVLTTDAVSDLKSEIKGYDGKAYDLYFEWSNERIYCSELVWKAYKDALDIEIGKLTRFADHDLSDPMVQAKLRERFGDDIPREEIVISPADMFASPRLETVLEK